MGKLAHAARSKPGSVPKPRAASPKAKARPRVKASWTFGGFDGGGLAAAGAQAKMEVSKPGDALEREADRMADRAMSGRAGASAGAPHDSDETHGAHVMRACDGCAEDEAPKNAQRKAQPQDEIERAERRGTEEERKVQRMAMGRSMGTEEEGKVHRLAEGHGEEGEGHDAAQGAGDEFEDRLRFAQLGGGAPLPGPLAAFMESRFGTSFQRVRVHVGDAGAALARSVRARAFTVGRHIFFGPGNYRPHTEQGRRLIAHELTHVMQQRGGLHSVQRDVEAVPPADSKSRAEDKHQAERDAAAPDAIPFARFMRVFNLREGVTPPAVLEVIKEMVELALHNLPQAEKLLPLLDPVRSAERTVRRMLRSRSHALRLETTRVPGSREHKTEWELQFLDRTRVEATGGRVSGGTDEDAIDVGDTGRPTQPAEPAADLKADLAKSAQPAAKPAPAVAEPPAGGGAGAAPAAPWPIETAAATPGGPAAGAVSAAAKEVTAAAEEKIPRTPEEDPNFKAVTAGAERAAKQSAAHGEGGAAAVNSAESAPVDTEEKKQHGQDKQVEKMSVQETPDFDVKKFVADVEAQVAANTPETLEKARNFKRDGTVGKIAAQVRTAAGAEADRTRAPLKSATDADPNATVAPRTAATLAPAPIGGKAKDVDAGRAVPPERPRSQVEGEIESNKQAVGAKMKELGVPDPETTLRTSNEPQMVGALGAKQTFDADAAEAPAEFRQGEAGERGAAKKENAAAGAEGLGTMFDTRSGLLGKVQRGQHGGKAKSESQHDRVKREVNEIYDATKTKVKNRLTAMEKTVFEKFDTGSKAALSDFENAVVDAEKRWNDKNIFERAADHVASLVTRLPTELEADLRAIRVLFIFRMKALVQEIAEIASRELKAAKDDVKNGREEIKKKIGTLGGDQADLKAELTKEFDGKFDALEGDIKKAREDMVHGVAERYRTSVAASDKLLKDVRDRNKGFLEKFKDKIEETIGSFVEMKAKLEAIFERAKGVIFQIMADPKKFMRNLFAGIGLGFQNFGNNILKHLVQGAVAWLTGAVRSAGIELPEHFDAAGILSIFLQLTGLTIENVKARARVIWGDKVVDLIEKGVAGAEKAFEIFEVFRKEGVMGLVRLLKEKFIALKDQALEKIKGVIQTEIVKAAIKFLLGLLTPVGALIKAVITIVNTVMFFVRNASRLADLINTIIDGVSDVLAGNITGLAVKVENALAAAVPIVLDFLASLLDIGTKVVEAIKNVIAFIRRPVEQAIDFMLTGIKTLIAPLIARVMGAFGMKPAEPAAAPGAAAHPTAGQAPAPAPPADMSHIGRPVSFTLGGASHTVFFRQTGTHPVLLIASEGGRPPSEFLADPNVKENSDPAKVAKANSLAQRTQAAADKEAKIIETHTEKPEQVAAADREVTSDEEQLARSLETLNSDERIGEAIQADLVRIGPVDETEIQRAIPGWAAKFGLKSLTVTTVGGTLWELHGETSAVKKLATFRIPGTDDNRFEIDWPKRAASQYKHLFFGGRQPTGIVRKQAELEQKFRNHGEDPIGTPVDEYSPLERKQLPEGEVIGLAPQFQLDVGSKIGPVITADNPGGGEFNDAVKPYGFSPTGETMNGDHVQDIQFSGPNDRINMWALGESENKSAGKKVSLAKVTVPGTQRLVSIPELKQNAARKYFFVIAKTRPV